MGRWSARLAPRFLEFANLAGARRVLDVGCGTGVLCTAIAAQTPEAEVAGVDPTDDFLAEARAKHPKMRFEPGEAAALPFADGRFDASLALLILQEVAAPEAAVGEMRRVTRPGGLVATAQWDFVAGMPMLGCFWDAVEAHHPPAATERSDAKRMPKGCRSEAELAALWAKCGLVKVATATIAVAQDFADFADYWTPFLSGATATSSYAATLPAQTRSAVERSLRSRLGEGPFTLTARAIAVKGLVPAG